MLSLVRKSFIAGTVFVICVAGSLPLASADTVKPLLQSTLTKYVQPAYSGFLDAASQFHSQSEALCDAPTVQQLEVTRNSFAQTVFAWNRIEWFRHGPVTSENRVERVLFYPDRKSTGLKQVQRALAKQDESVQSVATLSRKSVAMQGFGAADFLLSGSGHEVLSSEAGDFRCAYLEAVAGNLNSIATELDAMWTNGSDAVSHWQSPGDGNPFFRTEKEAKSALFATLLHGLEAVRDVRIGAFLGDGSEKRDRPKSALLWRSGLTMDTISANLQGLQEYYAKSRLADLLPEKSASIGKQVLFEFKTVINTASSLDGPISELLADETSRKKLVYLNLALGFLIDTVDKQFAGAAGLVSGFSFGDGD